MGSKGPYKKQKNVNKGESKGEGLIDLVFSWSLADVLNKDLYKAKVKPIPEMFSSTEEYMDSFIEPLIEETHKGLFSSIQTVHRAPTREILSVDICKPRKDLYYNISFNGKRDDESYEPKFGDLVALTEVRPKRMDDLHRPRSPYLIGFVHTEGECDSEKMDIRASKSIVLGEYGYRRKYKKKRSLFVVYLTSMITNLRIWMALKSELDGNMNVINRVLQPDSTVRIMTILFGLFTCFYCYNYMQYSYQGDHMSTGKEINIKETKTFY
ncbi:hypothetical protein RHSIM_Rhsim02G0186400 [Rhododendron simsii]|uniref:DUF6469 domain-containing protein n=1 Tax=Rhododendron simsii TaxID=118357 RepID=A0A834LTB4_RHOSS|nr:hypothetical protein RHSIM_Rhsim02G0186400 [Rhododendron simsii]